MSDEQRAIIAAQCIIMEHRCTLWEREHPEEIDRRAAIIEAKTPAERLELHEALMEIGRMCQVFVADSLDAAEDFEEAGDG